MNWSVPVKDSNIQNLWQKQWLFKYTERTYASSMLGWKILFMNPEMARKEDSEKS